MRALPRWLASFGWAPRLAVRLRFDLRLLVTLVLTLLAVGGVQYRVSERELREQIVNQGLQIHEADARELSRAFDEADPGEDRIAEVTTLLRGIQARPGVTDALLIDRSRKVAASGQGSLGVTVEPTAAVVAAIQRGERYAGTGSQLGTGDRDRFEFVLPVYLRGDPYALDIDRHEPTLEAQLGDHKRGLLWQLLLGLLVAVPLFYLLGGRSLSRQHRSAVRRSSRDPLTDLGNHGAFQHELRSAAAAATRTGQPLSLAVIDLDDFKVINDKHGHRQGDRVLREVARRLRAGRASDRPFRVGGDEFAVLLTCTDSASAIVAMERLRHDIGEHVAGLTLSIGVAQLAQDEADDVTLWERADAATYQVKRLGRDAVLAYEAIADSCAVATPRKIATLRRMLDDAGVAAAFQPIYDLRCNGTLGYEALARPMAEYGFGGPAEAFDIAERVGRVPELDDVCRRAILSRAVELPTDALLFVNIAPAALGHDLLRPEALVTAVEAAGLHPSRVVLEVTERLCLYPALVVREAAKLRELGFRLALDDVGAGNSGLEMLRHLTVDFVKIDRGVVVNAPSDRNARAVLMAILSFAAATDATVIAEGIETAQELEFLRTLPTQQADLRAGVQAVQGYLFGRPAHAMTPAAIPGAVADGTSSGTADRLEPVG